MKRAWMMLTAGLLTAVPLWALEITKDDKPTLDEMRKVLLSGSLRGREEAARRLLKDGSAEAMKALFDGMADKFAAYIVADVLLEAINEKKEGWVDKLLPGMEHEHWRARMLTAYSLGLCGDKKASPALSKALDDDNYNVRLYSAEALRYAGDIDAVDPLIKALRNFCCLIRLHAAAALGEIGDTKAVPALIVALDDPDAAINAAKALGKIGGEEAEFALMLKALGTRAADAPILLQQPGEHTLPAMEPPVGRKVVWAAVEALQQCARKSGTALSLRKLAEKSDDERTRKVCLEAAEAIERRAEE